MFFLIWFYEIKFSETEGELEIIILAHLPAVRIQLLRVLVCR